jgi:hypothetical protein
VYIDLKRIIDANETVHKTRKRKTLEKPHKSGRAKAVCAVEGSESDLLVLLVRAQVLTSAAKADTYFATLRRRFKGFEAGDCVLVKGPLKAEAARNAMRMNGWKERQGLPVLRMVEAQLALDRWQDGTPLGARNNADRECAFFLLTESTLAESALKRTTYREYKGKEWKDALVWQEGYNVSPSEMCEYVLLLLARWLFGVSDLADRNFILRAGHVYSIDEEYVGRPVNFKTELRAKCAFVGRWVAENYASLVSKMASWDVPR